MAEVIQTLFAKDIQSNLFPDNAFYKQSKADTGIEVNVETIEIPQAGSKPTVTTNPSSFPLAISNRTDSKKSYTATYFATNPIFINDMNAMVLSYDKRKDVIDDHVMALNSHIAEIIGNSWCPATATAALAKQTSGTTNRAANPSLGLTGNRKKVTADDIAYMKFLLDNADVPEDGRFALFPASMYNDLLSISAFQAYNNSSSNFSDLLPKGVLGEIFGFKIYQRSKTVVYSEDATLTNLTKRAVGASLTATDNEAAIFWHKSFVRRAEGNVKLYFNADVAEYQGSIMSAAVRAGGTSGYTANTGVAVLIQDNA